MLNSLHIENIALIEKADIEFNRGFNVLSGETGAGKSILIDSIHAVLGERTSRELIRTGCPNATVSAVFDDCSIKTLQLLEDLGFSAEDNTVLLQRRLNADGKNVCRVNGQPATTASLREIGASLLDIHGQHDNQALLDPARHVEYLDALGNLQPLHARYYESYLSLLELKQKIDRLKDEAQEQARQADFLRYQVEELEAAAIRCGEREELLAAKNRMTNSEKIVETVSFALQALDGDESEYSGIVSSLQEVGEKISTLAVYENKFQQLSERVLGFVYELEEISTQLRPYTDETEFDFNELTGIEERLDLLYRLSKKYGETEEEMLAVLQSAKEKLETVEHFDEVLEKLKNQFYTQKDLTKSLAIELSDARKQIAKQLCEQVEQELSELDMPKVTFTVHFEPGGLTPNGMESIEFLISANPGEEPRPLAKIASGGELSRIMLAIKSVLVQTDPVETLIFDEIDSGTSGRAAQKIGKKMKRIARDKQVICVTHLAQIACYCDHHFLIEKHVEGERTKTSVSPLDEKGRIYELARIMGGESITETTLCAARELLVKGAEQ